MACIHVFERQLLATVPTQPEKLASLATESQFPWKMLRTGWAISHFLTGGTLALVEIARLCCSQTMVVGA